MRARIKRITEALVTVELDDRTTGSVPIEEMFVSDHPRILLQNTIYAHPITLVVGQHITVTPVPGRPNYFSRRQAVIEAFRSARAGNVVSATIVEMNPRLIFSVSDEGYEVRLQRRETEDFLQSRFHHKRLDLDRAPEEDWLYLHDRIRVQLAGGVESYVMTGHLVTGNPARCSDRTARVDVAFGPPAAPRSRFKQVLVVDDNDQDILALEPYFTDGGYVFDFVMSAPDLAKWCGQYRRKFIPEELNPDGPRTHPEVLALICLDSAGLHWRDTMELIAKQLPSPGIILTSRAQSAHKRSDLKTIRSTADGCDLLGEWKKDSPLDALSALISAQTSLSRFFGRDGGDPDAGKGAPYGASTASERELGRRVSLMEDCTAVLETLLHLAGQRSAPCAAILFQIDKKSHSVRVLAQAGENRIIEGFQRYESNLRKSPVRDLAIYRQNSDTSNAREAGLRFIYFLDAMGGPREDLSVLGFRPSSPMGSPCAYAAFLFSRRLNAFAGNPLLTAKAAPLVGRLLEIVLGAADAAASGERLCALAEESSDFRFMAHEARDHLADSVTTVVRCVKNGSVARADRNRLHDGLSRTWTVISQMLPGTDPRYETFSPNKSVCLLFTLLKQLSLDSEVFLTLDTSLREDVNVNARRLVFDCVLRNLVLNAVQQIREYSGGAGTVRVELSLLKEETGEEALSAVVEDDGPGIHWRYWESIFSPGKSSRKDGTGLGLAASRRLACLAKGRVELLESHVYSGTSFRLVLPIAESSVHYARPKI